MCAGQSFKSVSISLSKRMKFEVVVTGSYSILLDLMGEMAYIDGNSSNLIPWSIEFTD